MNRLKDRIALITGTGDGIGRGIAVAFAEEGAKLAVCDVNDTALTDTERILAKITADVLAEQVDVRDPAQIQSFVESSGERYGRIDCLVNNAAVMPVVPTEELNAAIVDQILEANLRALILFSKAVIPYMRKGHGGSIIHMASVTGHLGHPGISVYGATKGGLMALARGQAVELARDNIRVNTVSPGTVDSPMLHRFLEDNATDPAAARISFDRLHPRGRVGTIEEVAAVFVFLASAEAANITGTDIRCDGGYAAAGKQPTE